MGRKAKRAKPDQDRQKHHQTHVRALFTTRQHTGFAPQQFTEGVDSSSL
jgi:hypothetical protein